MADKLQLPLDTCRDELLTRTAPDGKQWKLRLLVTDRMPELPVGQALRPVEPEDNVELVSPPEVTEQQDSNATVTALAAFANCPRQYYLGHYLGFEGRRGNWRRRRKWAAFPPANSAPRCTRCWREARFPSRTRKRCAWPRFSARARWAAAWPGPPAWSGNSIS